MTSMPDVANQEQEAKEKMQLEFTGCVFPVPSDNSGEPVMLTREQSLQIIEVIYSSFKRCYGQ